MRCCLDAGIMVRAALLGSRGAAARWSMLGRGGVADRPAADSSCDQKQGPSLHSNPARERPATVRLCHRPSTVGRPLLSRLPVFFAPHSLIQVW